MSGKSEIRNPKSDITIGVLALQGAFEKHVEMLDKCGIRTLRVRFIEEMDSIHGLIIPGGESTTVGKLMARYGLDKKIIQRAGEGMPILGTCTGMILLAKDIVGSDQHRLGLMDMRVLRNAFGRQIDSFEADLEIDAVGKPAFHAVFIRAPYVEKANGSVETLAQYEDKTVLLRQGNLLGCSFHPELTDDMRIHQYFAKMVRDSLSSQGKSCLDPAPHDAG